MVAAEGPPSWQHEVFSVCQRCLITVDGCKIWEEEDDPEAARKEEDNFEIVSDITSSSEYDIPSCHRRSFDNDIVNTVNSTDK